MRALAAAFVLALAVSARAAPDPDDYYPPDAGQVEVPCPGGDVTAALTACMRGASSGVGFGYQVCRLGPGTCPVSDTIAWRAANGNWQSNVALVGRGSFPATAGGTRIALADYLWNDPNASHPMLYMASEDSISVNPDGHGNKAFGNFVSNLAIDTRKNVGAIGIDAIVSNMGALRDVAIYSSTDTPAVAAVQAGRYAWGPGLVEDVTIGPNFRWALDLHHLDYGMTLLSSYFRSPARVLRNLLFAQGLRIDAANGPALRHAPEPGDVWPYSVGLVTDSTFNGSGPAAVDMPVASGLTGGLFVQRSSSTYAALAAGSGPSVPGAFGNLPAHSAFAADDRTTLGLTVPAWPAYDVLTPADWQRCTGCNPTDALDDSPALQAALDSGKRAVYAVSAGTGGPRYTRLLTPVHIPRSVRVLHFFHGSVQGAGTSACTITIDSGSAEPLWIVSGWSRGVRICNASARPVVVQDWIGAAFDHTGTGPAFLKNVSIDSITIGPRSAAYGKQVNCETDTGEGCVVNDGGKFWVLGLKGESHGTPLVMTKHDGCTEVLGGQMYEFGPNGAPLFVVRDARFSAAAFGTTSYTNSSPYGYPVIVRETRACETADLGRFEAGAGTARGLGKSWALVSAHQGPCPF